MYKIEYEKLIAEQTIRQQKGYLTRTERELLTKMVNNPKDYIKEDKVPILGDSRPIITDRAILSQPSDKVTANDDIKGIIKALKDTLATHPGAMGLSAPQIGIKKCISYIRMPSINKEKKSIEYSELVLINPKIIEKSRPIRLKGEGCLSFPGIHLETERFVFITVQYQDENLKEQLGTMQDMEGFACQHEVDHLGGILFFNRKHKAR